MYMMWSVCFQVLCFCSYWRGSFFRTTNKTHHHHHRTNISKPTRQAGLLLKYEALEFPCLLPCVNEQVWTTFASRLSLEERWTKTNISYLPFSKQMKRERERQRAKAIWSLAWLFSLSLTTNFVEFLEYNVWSS